MNKKRGQLIVALDLPTFKEAKKLIEVLGNTVDIYKVGSQLFIASGSEIIHYLSKKGKRIFFDLKFHDIPNTVASSVAAAVSLSFKNGQPLVKNSGIMMMTVHIQGGKEMLKAAVRSSRDEAGKLKISRPLIIGVTVLTSDVGNDNVSETVLERTQLAKKCGLDGVVASSQEAAMLREEFGNDLVIVTPGIRPLGSQAGDQKRVATPADAIINGSDFLVVGRPIVQSDNPLKAAKEILKEIQEA